MKYIPLFLLIQICNLVLLPFGLVVCLWPKLAKLSWIFWNSIDPPTGSWWATYVWLALRNPVSNLRLIPGVSRPGRPLWLKSILLSGKSYHAMAGWLGTTGYPVLSIGTGSLVMTTVLLMFIAGCLGYIIGVWRTL